MNAVVVRRCAMRERFECAASRRIVSVEVSTNEPECELSRLLTKAEPVVMLPKPI